MDDLLAQLKEMLSDLSEEHGVDPLLLGILYIVSKVSVIIMLALMIRNMRAKKPFTMILLFAALCFCIPYVYFIIAGRNIHFGVYIFIGLIFVYGGYAIRKKIVEKARLIS
ncbi:hypothetical protein INP83_03225 [Mucilaginibacter sp. 21P]|uniref:hypothetical protein n=1 Tax=Mucilaginibacter sp. 21P TaxID=2778902 RepID=UPI001C57B6FD|nr:hypothetical protein [Mucilaginibacter sp. 21P]QXV66120.1 hypothetical protein INP83_03225 [Mucilaginibacter sp. 21P]